MKFPETHINDSIIISSIGYKTKKYPINKNGDSILNIILHKTIYKLPVDISYISANDIREKAFENIPKNYSNNVMYLSGFYRERSKQPRGRGIQKKHKMLFV